MRIAGYAAIYDAPDKGGDVVRRGAFASASEPLPLFWQHDPSRRIGTVTHLAEDARGLRMIAELDAATPTLVRAGQGLSFGYRVRKSSQDQYRNLLGLDLIEISLVSHPLQPLARVLRVEDG
jgi:uncharacterized protein